MKIIYIYMKNSGFFPKILIVDSDNLRCVLFPGNIYFWKAVFQNFTLVI